MKIGNKGNGSLGDCLYLTSILRYIKDATISLHKDEQSRWVGRIFENLCDVEYSAAPPERPDQGYLTPNFNLVHRTRKILLSLGIQDKVSVPFVKLTKKEIDFGRELVSQYKNPIVVSNDNSGNWDETNIRANYVKPPTHIMQRFVDGFLDDGLTPIQFGRVENNRFTPLNNTVPIRGLNVRELAACYKAIGRYFGGDTGDYHLMLATGGIAEVLIPKESHELGYLYDDLLYKPENFEDCRSRVTYINFN